MLGFQPKNVTDGMVSAFNHLPYHLTHNFQQLNTMHIMFPDIIKQPEVIEYTGRDAIN